MRQQLSDAVEDYLSYRRSQAYAKGTMENDRGALKRFLTVTGNIYVHNIGAHHVTRHFEESAKTRQASSLVGDHSTLRRFFQWCRATKRMSLDTDPMFGRRTPITPKRERERIHVSRFPHLLNVAGERDPRDRAVVAGLLYTLLRDQELASLRVGDVDLDSGFIRVKITKTYVEDRLPISLELDRELRDWLARYGAGVGGLRPDHYLFPARKKGALTHGADGRIVACETWWNPEGRILKVGKIVRPALEAAGFPVRDPATGKALWEGAHTIRRSGARALFDALTDTGHDHALRIVQSMLHHSSVTMTERYIGVTADRRTRDDLIRGQALYPAAFAVTDEVAGAGRRASAPPGAVA